MFILPVHYESPEGYERLKRKARDAWPDQRERWAERHAEDLYPYWFYNDLAGLVELRVEGSDLKYTIFACRSQTPPHKWRHDRRLKGRFSWYDMGHWSLKTCKNRKDYLAALEKCLLVIRGTVPAKFYLDWEPWRPLFAAVDWASLRSGSHR